MPRYSDRYLGVIISNVSQARRSRRYINRRLFYEFTFILSKFILSQFYSSFLAPFKNYLYFNRCVRRQRSENLVKWNNSQTPACLLKERKWLFINQFLMDISTSRWNLWKNFRNSEREIFLVSGYTIFEFSGPVHFKIQTSSEIPSTF